MGHAISVDFFAAAAKALTNGYVRQKERYGIFIIEVGYWIISPQLESESHLTNNKTEGGSIIERP